MKKFMTDIKTLAALLMAGAAFTACSSSDDNIIEQPQNPTEPQVYTMVIKASKGGDATTRALKPGTDSETGKNTVDAYWSGDETIEVYQSGKKIGTATAAPSADGNTTVTATLTSAPVPSNDLNFYLGGYNNVYTGQNGLLTGTNSISEKYDYAESLIYSNAYTVEGYDVIPGEFTTLSFTDGITKQAIIKFTLKDKANDAAISPSALTVTDGTSTVSLTSIPATTYTANGEGVLYVAFPAVGSAKTITLTATVGSDTYTYTTSSAKTFVNGNYYEITVKMTKMEPLRIYTDATIQPTSVSDGTANYSLPYLYNGYNVTGAGKANITATGSLFLRFNNPVYITGCVDLGNFNSDIESNNYNGHYYINNPGATAVKGSFNLVGSGYMHINGNIECEGNCSVSTMTVFVNGDINSSGHKFTIDGWVVSVEGNITGTFYLLPWSTLKVRGTVTGSVQGGKLIYYEEDGYKVYYCDEEEPEDPEPEPEPDPDE